MLATARAWRWGRKFRTGKAPRSAEYPVLVYRCAGLIGWEVLDSYRRGDELIWEDDPGAFWCSLPLSDEALWSGSNAT